MLQYCVLFLQLCAGWGRFANWPHFKTPWAQRDMGWLQDENHDERIAKARSSKVLAELWQVHFVYAWAGRRYPADELPSLIMFDSLKMLEPVEKWDCPKSLEVNLLAAFGEYMIRHKLTLQFCFLWIQNSLCNTKDCLFLAPAEVRTLKCSCVSFNDRCQQSAEKSAAAWRPMCRIGCQLRSHRYWSLLPKTLV